MIVGRGLQGVGMGLIPLGISAMRDVLPAERLGTSIALMSASMGVGGALGLPLAAAVAQSLSWRVLFWGSAVLALVILALIHSLVPTTPVSAERAGFDHVGAVGLSVGLVLLLLGVSKGGDWGWSSTVVTGLLAGSVVVLVVWGWFELRMAHPLVDLRLAARPVVLLTNLASVMVGFAMYAQSLIVPQLMQLPVGTGYGLGFSMLEMGLWIMPGGLMMMLVSPVGARISHLRGPRTTLVLGALVIAVGYGCAAALMATAVGLAVSVGIVSSGIGLAYGAMPALIMGSVPVTETASANSFNALARSVGTSVAAAVVGVVLAQMSVNLDGYSIPTEQGFRTGLLMGAGVALVAALIAVTIPRRASREAEDRIEHELPVAPR
jgi:MFS family permease